MKIINKWCEFIYSDTGQELIGLVGTLYFAKKLIKCVYKDLHQI